MALPLASCALAAASELRAARALWYSFSLDSRKPCALVCASRLLQTTPNALCASISAKVFCADHKQNEKGERGSRTGK